MWSVINTYSVVDVFKSRKNNGNWISGCEDRLVNTAQIHATDTSQPSIMALQDNVSILLLSYQGSLRQLLFLACA